MKLPKIITERYKLKLLLGGFLILPFLVDVIFAILTGYSESPFVFGVLPSRSPIFLIIVVPIFLIWSPYIWISQYVWELITGVPASKLHTVNIGGYLVVMLALVYAYLIAAVIIHLFIYLKSIRKFANGK